MFKIEPYGERFTLKKAGVITGIFDTEEQAEGNKETQEKLETEKNRNRQD